MDNPDLPGILPALLMIASAQKVVEPPRKAMRRRPSGLGTSSSGLRKPRESMRMCFVLRPGAGIIRPELLSSTKVCSGPELP